MIYAIIPTQTKSPDYQKASVCLVCAGFTCGCAVKTKFNDLSFFLELGHHHFVCSHKHVPPEEHHNMFVPK